MEIVWTELADESFDEIITYIRAKFTEREVDNFVLSTYEVLNAIQSYPKLFPASTNKLFRSTRKAVIHPHTTLFYRISSVKRITLITFWDNRWDPNKYSH